LRFAKINKMRFPLTLVLALATSSLALPVAQRDNASSTTANNLANGINANLDAGNKELDGIQASQSAIQNNGNVAGAEQGVQGALTEAVGDREKNQAAAGGTGGSNPTPVQAGLDKVQKAQEGAQANVNSLTGTAADSSTLSTLQGTFEKGFATNENNLQLVSESLYRKSREQSLVQSGNSMQAQANNH
jgi:hypothetical protein